MKIRFNTEKNMVLLVYEKSPLLKVSRVFLTTEDRDWAHKIVNKSIAIRFAARDAENNVVFHNSKFIPLSVSPYQINPVFEMNEVCKPDVPMNIGRPILKWDVEIELINPDFDQHESLTLEITD